MNTESHTEIFDQIFSKVIGQTKAKNRVKELILGAVNNGGYFPSILLAAPAGTGKTKFLACIAEAVRAVMGRKGFMFESGNELGSKTGFIEDVLIPHVHDNSSVVYVDEFHEAPKPVAAIIRQLLDVTIARNVRKITHQGEDVNFDPAKNSFVVATNKIDKLDIALMSRLEQISLELYSDEELFEILSKGIRELPVPLQVNENTIQIIAQCNRGTARDVVRWVLAIEARASIKGKRQINREDAREIIKMRDTFPLGLTTPELNTLLFLEKAGQEGLQLQQLAARNQCESKEQKVHERYLFQRGLISTDSVRKISNDGKKYLAELREEQYI
jgi:Holliday junction resolvasome RuvABC ATP-dependent DNA helicase subunit